MQTSVEPEADQQVSPARPSMEIAVPKRKRPLPFLLLKAMRPLQWTKNGLLFAALLFGLPQVMTSAEAFYTAVFRAFAAFALFCLFSSAVYLFNDVRDKEKDALSARTAKRPIASGELDVRIAVAAVAVMLPIGFVLAYLLNPWFALVAAIYIIKDLGYSFGLKHVVIIDVILVAAGFTIRAVAGAIAVEVPISPWLYVLTTLGALFLALNKRKHEILLLDANAGSHRKVLDDYSPALIEEMLAVVTASTVMAYALYTFTADNLPPRLKENHLMMLTVPFVLYGIFRYLYLVYQKNEGSTPEEVLVRDKPLLACIVLWILTSATLLLVFR